ncbi:alkaline protease 1 [Fusarium longipes]|uniref:Alkaline protease 1 n=1 Tax=Fusarium longipes TaxID=694270 RepID=A0A395RYP7_9HYPO|nr:alkaline protease 1 [Fusarium longipes]
MEFIIFFFLLTQVFGQTFQHPKLKNADVEPQLVVPNTYIIKYKENVSTSSKKKHEEGIDKMAKTKGKEGVLDNFNLHDFKGYVADISKSELHDIVNSDLVDYVEPDTIVNMSAITAPSLGPLTKRGYTTQLKAPWGLARISRSYSGEGLDPRYTYDNTAGAGINVYVLDSGIRTTHKDFGGRAIWGANFITGSPDTDEFGHGTHVAGTIGGKTYGVAKRCKIYAVKVLDKDGIGSWSVILQGLQWAVDHARSHGRINKSVINASLGGGFTQIGNDVVKSTTDLGMTIVVSAGNEASDAANFSPGSAPSAITVGATDGSDWRSMWSNYGTLVDIYAPGTDILSAGHLSDTSSVYMSGTSMASPHVAGLAAYFMAKDGVRGSTAVTNRILAAADVGFIDLTSDSPQRLASNSSPK